MYIIDQLFLKEFKDNYKHDGNSVFNVLFSNT